MCSYGSDGTALLCRTHFPFELGGLMQHRQVGASIEYQMQKFFMKTVPYATGPTMVAFFRPPRPMTNGKTAWHLCQAYQDFLPHLRTGEWGAQRLVDQPCRL